jgi:hypothetical protein
LGEYALTLLSPAWGERVGERDESGVGNWRNDLPLYTTPTKVEIQMREALFYKCGGEPRWPLTFVPGGDCSRKFRVKMLKDTREFLQNPKSNYIAILIF